MSKETAWVMVNPDGNVFWSTADTSKRQCCLNHSYWSWRQDPTPLVEQFEAEGYSFERVAVIPEGCEVCRQMRVPRSEEDYQDMSHPWRPVE